MTSWNHHKADTHKCREGKLIHQWEVEPTQISWIYPKIKQLLYVCQNSTLCVSRQFAFKNVELTQRQINYRSLKLTMCQNIFINNDNMIIYLNSATIAHVWIFASSVELLKWQKPKIHTLVRMLIYFYEIICFNVGTVQSRSQTH